MEKLLEQILKIPNESPKLFLKEVLLNFPDKVIFSTSFGLEDQIITHVLATEKLNVEIFTLDTGRMFPETYSTWNRTREHYKINIKAYFPQNENVEKLLNSKGTHSFYESLENRKECCFIRKVEPLKRALANKKIWITGIRAEQSNSRSSMKVAEIDNENQLIKIHPLYHWTWQDCINYAQKNKVISNPLHDKKFLSIGCQPCTRAIKEGESFRSGRWWWEDTSQKECGLHITQK